MIVELLNVIACQFKRVAERIIAQFVARKMSKPTNTVENIGYCLPTRIIRTPVNILDLLDKILLSSCKELNRVDDLYSLVDVNQRFDRLALDPLYIRDLDMTDIMMKYFQ